MAKKSEDDDLEDVRREEVARGRRTYDSKRQRERRERRVDPGLA